MIAFLFTNVDLQLSVETDNQVIAFVNIGGDPPLYSGAQKIKPLDFINNSLKLLTASVLMFRFLVHKEASQNPLMKLFYYLCLHNFQSFLPRTDCSFGG